MISALEMNNKAVNYLSVFLSVRPSAGWSVRPTPIHPSFWMGHCAWQPSDTYSPEPLLNASLPVCCSPYQWVHYRSVSKAVSDLQDSSQYKTFDVKKLRFLAERKVHFLRNSSEIQFTGKVEYERLGQ